MRLPFIMLQGNSKRLSWNRKHSSLYKSTLSTYFYQLWNHIYSSMQITYHSYYVSFSNASQVFAEKDFLNLTNDSLCHLFKSDELDINEMALFNALLEYKQ